MKLTIRDIGAERYLEILRRRLNPLSPYTSPQTTQKYADLGSRPRKKTKRIYRYWLRGLPLDGDLYDKTEEVMAASPSYNANFGVAITFSVLFLLPALIMMALSAPGFVTLTFSAIWALMIWATLLAPRTTIKRTLAAPLTVAEVETLLPNARGRLDRSYLTLVLDALRHESSMSPSAQADVRAALSALGDTISRLPAGPVPNTDPILLRREAEEFRLEAGREGDAFVRASFLRQAESLEKRAELGSENAVSARRISALRREARTQMNALRALLAAFSQTAPGEAAQNVALADAVSRVSGEAQAISQAHRELADAEIAALLGHPMPSHIPVQPTQTPRPVSVSPSYGTQTGQAAGGNPNAQPPVQQVGNGNGTNTGNNGNNGTGNSGRPWWRG